MTEKGNIPIMKVDLTLRSDKPCADAGWGMDLIGWHWKKFIHTYDSSIIYKKGLSFYIRGEKGGENIGISMKSDRRPPIPGEAASDEEKLPLKSMGITITKEWQKVIVPFGKLPNFSRYTARNIAFYLNTPMMKKSSESQVIYIKGIDFW